MRWIAPLCYYQLPKAQLVRKRDIMAGCSLLPECKFQLGITKKGCVVKRLGFPGSIASVIEQDCKTVMNDD